MGNGWLDQVIDEILRDAKAEGMSPEVVATSLHDGKLSLHVPGRVGIAAAATIVARYLPVEIRDRGVAMRSKRIAEERQKASAALERMMECLQAWGALPEDQRGAKAVDTKQRVLALSFGPIQADEGGGLDGDWKKQSEARGMYPIRR